MMPNEEIITKEQLYKILHISKRRAKFLLDNGYIPCIDTGKKTRRYQIKLSDVQEFIDSNVEVENAPWLLSIMETIDPDNYDSLQYFERVLRSSGIIDALIKNGINEGDTVSVYDIEFDYVV